METNEPVDSSIPVPPDLLPKVPALKQEYGDLFLFQTGDQVFAHRPLTLDELAAYRELAQANQVEGEEVVLGAVVYPEGAKDLIEDMGIADADRLINQILANSSAPTIKDIVTALDSYRGYANTGEGLMIAWVCAAFPGMTLNKVRKLSQTQLFLHVALAEVILQRQLQLEEQKPKKKRGFGMMAPDFSQAQQHPQPTGVTKPPAFDFQAENREMGFEGLSARP